MVEGGTQESPGDNIEFPVAAAGDVTVYLNGGASGSNTSANDTESVKYFDHAKRRKNFCLRADKAVQVISINGVVLTSPYTMAKNKSITEKWDTALLFKMVIRIITAATNIKLRVR